MRNCPNAPLSERPSYMPGTIMEAGDHVTDRAASQLDEIARIPAPPPCHAQGSGVWGILRDGSMRCHISD